MDMEQLSLFDTGAVYDPLASRTASGESGRVCGTDDIFWERGSFCASSIDQDSIPLHDFLGASGRGKNHPCQALSQREPMRNLSNFSAVTSGIKEIREVMAQAEQVRLHGQQDCCLCGRDPPFQ